LLTGLKNIVLFFVFIGITVSAKSQLCPTDSNYYLKTYTGLESNYIDDAVITSDNEIVTLGHYSAFGSFVSKFTAQGSNIWSNEYQPNYPRVNFLQFPWYNNTNMEGISQSTDASFYVYGYSTEHGRSINNVEQPAEHKVGAMLHIDKFGNIITSKYFGNWGTEYKVSNVLKLSNGNLIVYLVSLLNPFISKVLYVSEAGDLFWAAPLQTKDLYKEVNATKPVLCQLKNGNIALARIMVRNIADTLRYPFLPDIILPAPLNYFHLFELDGKTGNLIWETSYQCPTLTNTNVPNTFIPGLKNIVQLSNGNLSLLADMYLPIDNERFYENKIYSRRAVNFTTDAEGFLKKFIAYRVVDGSCNLESVKQIGNNGDRLLASKDFTNQQIILYKINNEGKIIWNKFFKNTIPTPSSKVVALEKQNSKGFFIVQSDVGTFDFKASISNAIGNNPCVESTGNIIAIDTLWPWLFNKVQLFTRPADIDFRYSPFVFQQSKYTLTQNTNCEYQFICCKDVIDSINIKKITICPGETYTLADNTKVKDSGTYYGTLKTTRGCDSIVFYNVTILKSPNDLIASPDTCLSGASSIQIRATEGYSSYLWNNISSNNSFYSITAPGNYTIKVANKCGIKIDTISVYSDCDFPIYFPNAFSPNNDYLNDILKIPIINKNKLLQLRVFNRLGQIVFKTSNINQGWDGTFKGLLQPIGAYVYVLEMEGLSGKKINQKGTIILIR
jgi:gliding motility-associated-like protein